MEDTRNTSPTNVSSTITLATDNTSNATMPNTLRLTATNAAAINRRRVSWTTETVDNEGMGKKKSKCCCIYQKPRAWDQSSEEDENEDEDCQNCRGHRKKDFNSKTADKAAEGAHHHQHEHDHGHNHHEHSDWNGETSESAEIK